MNISQISYKNYFSQLPVSSANSGMKNFEYNKFFSFRGSQIKPLTDEDYEIAKKNLPVVIDEARKSLPKNFILNLEDVDLDKINGLQKDIKVFEGLTMNEIGFVLTNTALLLNRGCSNNCAHCALMATSITSKTYDRMSYEDFKLFVDGVSELQKRVGDDICVIHEMQPFFDSDCIDIQIKDKNNNTYDYIDCVDYMLKNGFPEMLLDTSGWNPKSEKMQKRAEKFVEYLKNMPDKSKVHVNVSINPYHILITEAMNAENNRDFDKANQLKNKYVERMANTLFTFAPLLDSDVDINIISRAVPKSNCVNNCHYDELYDLSEKIVSSLNTMFANDFQTDKKVIKSALDFSFKSFNIANRFRESLKEEHSDVVPIGRARNLIIRPIFTFRMNKDYFDMLLKQRELSDMNRCINPNGSVVLNRNDLSARTSINLNFENSDKKVKKLAIEKDNFVYNV